MKCCTIHVVQRARIQNGTVRKVAKIKIFIVSDFEIQLKKKLWAK